MNILMNVAKMMLVSNPLNHSSITKQPWHHQKITSCFVIKSWKDGFVFDVGMKVVSITFRVLISMYYDDALGRCKSLCKSIL